MKLTAEQIEFLEENIKLGELDGQIFIREVKADIHGDVMGEIHGDIWGELHGKIYRQVARRLTNTVGE